MLLVVVVATAALSVGFSEATGGGGASLLGALENDLAAGVVDSELV